MTKFFVEWGTIKGGTRYKICGVHGQTTLTSAKHASQLARQLLHVLTNGGHDAPDEDFKVSQKNPRVIAWTNNGLSWVAVTIENGADSPVASSTLRSVSSTCSEEAAALGFTTDAEMLEHQAWLIANGSESYRKWQARILWHKAMIDHTEGLVVQANTEEEVAKAQAQNLTPIVVSWITPGPHKALFNSAKTNFIHPVVEIQDMAEAYRLVSIGKICIGHSVQPNQVISYFIS